MRHASRHAKVPIAVLAVVGAGIVGVGAGAAFAASPLLAPTPAGLAAEPTGTPAVGSDPSYRTNAQGLTFGSALDASSPENEPDLIQAEATNGKTGYVLKKDLDEANGAAAAETFKSPEEALAWQDARRKAGPVAINVYDVDGKTVIGEFLIGE